MRKYVAAAFGSAALASLFGYLTMAWMINAVGEAVTGMGDIEEDFDDYDRYCPDVVCVDGVDGFTPEMLRRRDIPLEGTAKYWDVMLGSKVNQSSLSPDQFTPLFEQEYPPTAYGKWVAPNELTDAVVDLQAYKESRGR